LKGKEEQQRTIGTHPKERGHTSQGELQSLKNNPYCTNFRAGHTSIYCWSYNKEKGTEIEVGYTDFEVSLLLRKSIQGSSCTCNTSGNKNRGNTAMFSDVLGRIRLCWVVLGKFVR
jgi:hypothetical protein